MKSLQGVKINVDGMTLKFNQGVYPNGRIALWLEDADHGHYCDLTKNLPNEYLAPNHFFVKDYSENIDIAKRLLKETTLFRDTGLRGFSGHVRLPVWTFSDSEKSELDRTFERIALKHGFCQKEDVDILANHESTRLRPLLVRCGCGRFTAPCQDVHHFINIIERDYYLQKKTDSPMFDTDYIRDVSVPVFHDDDPWPEIRDAIHSSFEGTRRGILNALMDGSEPGSFKVTTKDEE